MHLRGVWVFKHVGSMHVFVWTLFVKPVMGSMTLFIFVFISVHELWLQLQALVSQGRRREGSSRKGGGRGTLRLPTAGPRTLTCNG